MNRTLAIIAICILPVLGFGQKSIPINPQLMLKIAPLSLIDVFGNTSCLMSLESTIKSNYTISIDAGFMFHSLAYGLENNRGWRTGIELRRYTNKNASRYFAINSTYKQQRYEFSESIRPPSANEYERLNAYDKQVVTLNLLYGVQKIVKGKRFFINPYGGFGVRYKNSQNTGLTQEEEAYRDYGDSQVLPFINELGENWHLNVVLGFRVGVVLLN